MDDELPIYQSPIHLKKFPGLFAEGFYAFVFFVGDRAIKVFKRRAVDQESHVRQVFQSEVMAYQQALGADKLQDLVSHFIGPVRCAAISDAAGNDISQEFVLDCAYEMRCICGDFKKLGTLDERIQDETRRLFYAAGIRHVKDCSVVVSDGRASSVIDFAMQEY